MSIRNVGNLLSRVTGFSTPIGGVSWENKPKEVSVAKQLLARLEDRRVLYNPSDAESPHGCVQSITEIRRELSVSLAQLEGTGPLSDNIRALGAACRSFHDRLGSPDRDDYEDMTSWGHWRSWQFQDALGQLRGIFGVHIAIIADRYAILIPEQLSIIVPTKPKEDELNDH